MICYNIVPSACVFYLFELVETMYSQLELKAMNDGMTAGICHQSRQDLIIRVDIMNMIVVLTLYQHVGKLYEEDPYLLFR